MTDKVTIPQLSRWKREGRKIVSLTAYDYPFARLVDQAGIDLIIVGDTLGVVVQGLESTLPVALAEMLYHTKMVSRAVRRALVVGDMPFLSFQPGLEETIRNAGRFLKEAGAAAVKIEGGAAVADRIEALSRLDIPVMAHIGLTPQSVHRMGGYKVQGKEPAGAKRLLEDAKRVESAGAFALVLEGMPAGLAKKITRSVTIPTIGIGAGPHCDGQVLVLHDLLGLFERFHPKFVRRYADLSAVSLEALRRYREDVQGGKFPDRDESYA
jgi:3-methyl-2-oxobutanoate hydroxymethyltransferase